MWTKLIIKGRRAFNVVGPVAAVLGGLAWMYQTGKSEGLGLLCKWLEQADEVVVNQEVGEPFKVVRCSLDGTETEEEP